MAANLANAIQVEGATVGVGATASSNVVTITATALGSAGNSITLADNFSSGFAWSPGNALSGSLSGGLDGSDTGTNFSISSSTTAEATNLANAINRNGGTVGVNASAIGSTVTVTAANGGAAGNSIGLTETLANFAWSGATLTGGVNGQPSLVAFNNLYVNGSGTGFCSGLTSPSVKWAYRTTGDAITTSPVLSWNGSKVAYVEDSTTKGVLPVFHVLTIGTSGSNGNIVNPATPGVGNNAADVSIPYGTTNGNTAIGDTGDGR